MKRFLILALSVLMLVTKPVSAPAQLGTVVTGLSIGKILDDLETGVKNLIMQAGSEMRYSILVAAQQMLLVIDNARAAYKDMLNETEEKLNAQQKQVFDSVRATMADLDMRVKNRLDNVTIIAKIAESAIIRLPGAKRTPRVLRYTPDYVATGDGAVPVVIEGSLLAQGKPKLMIGGKIYSEPNQFSDTSMTFAVKREDLGKAENSVKLVSADLTVYEDTRWFLGLFGALKEKPYRIVFYVVPPYLGEVKLTAIGKSMQRDTQQHLVPKQGVFRIESGDYDDRSACFGFDPIEMDQGWRIDVTSLQWVQHYLNHGGFNGFVNSNTQKGFVCLSATPFGNYSKRLGISANKGVISGQVQFTQYRDVNREWRRLVAVQELQLLWAKEVAFDLPPDTLGFLAEIKQIDGRSLVIDGTRTERWIALDWNPSARRVIIRPKDLTTAIRQ